MTATDTLPACPKCSGPVWDNRATKRNPKAPDLKCRDKACDGVHWNWPPKGGNGAQKPAPAPAPQPASFGQIRGLDEAPVASGSEFKTLCAKYAECVEYVASVIVPQLSKGPNAIGSSPESVSAMAATLFIARKDAGV